MLATQADLVLAVIVFVFITCIVAHAMFPPRDRK